MALAWLSPDGRKLLASRALRTFGYGFLAVALGLYLQDLGLSAFEVGVVLAAAVAGSALMNVLWTLAADRFGRRRTVVTMAVLMIVGGLVFAASDQLWLLVVGACTGTISASSAEVGPFVTVEQAILPQTTADERRTWLFSVYDTIGTLAGAAGALFTGVVGVFARLGLTGASAYRPLFVIYAGIGLLNLLIFLGLSEGVESARIDGVRRFVGLHRSTGTVAKLSALFGLDAFAGGFVLQSIVAYWFHVRWGLSPATLGVVFFWVGVLSGLSLLAAGWLAARVGLLNTMVFTHLPSNLLLILVPLAPAAPVSAAGWRAGA
jgi:MFS family permease